MNLSIYILTFIFGYLVTLILIPINIKFSRKYNIIDKPHDRGIHHEDTPSAGGLSFGVTLILLQLVLYIINELKVFEINNGDKFIYIMIGCILMLILGFLDDKKKFTARYKLFFQILIVCFMYLKGFRMDILTNPIGPDIYLGVFTFPMTIIWFILVINAFNLIDGLDGLAAGIASIVSFILLVVGIAFNNSFISLMSIMLLSTNVAFLRFNFFPAKIFMGDTGSLILGFCIAAVSVAGTEQYKGITTMTMLVPITVLILPLGDTLLAVYRRMKHRKHIFQADKEHIHHKLLDLGFSQKIIALISYFITFMFGLIALGFSFTSKKILFLVLIFVALILIMIGYLFVKGTKK
ncbi:MraY family glycosyltransferase [Candidatus Cloacimonadota bacterium]